MIEVLDYYRVMTNDDVDAGTIAGLLLQVTEKARLGFERVAEESDLTPAQIRALLTLEEPSPMRGLAGNLGCDASNVTGIADRLEARGLIRRETGSDRRMKLLALTPQGRVVRDLVRSRLSECSPATIGLSDDERRTLKVLLLKMAGPAEGPPPEVPSGG